MDTDRGGGAVSSGGRGSVGWGGAGGSTGSAAIWSIAEGGSVRCGRPDGLLGDMRSMLLGGGTTGELGSITSRDGTRRRFALLKGAGTNASSGGRPVGLNGSIGGRFLSGGLSPAGLSPGALSLSPDGRPTIGVLSLSPDGRPTIGVLSLSPEGRPAIGLSPVGLWLGLGEKAGARAGGGRSGVLLNGGAPFGLPRDLGRRLSSPLLYELATESWLLLPVASLCLRGASWLRRFRFESTLGARLEAGDELPLGGMGLREGVRV